MTTIVVVAMVAQVRYVDDFLRGSVSIEARLNEKTLVRDRREGGGRAGGRNRGYNGRT